MKIAIIGAGAVGGLFGATLHRSDQEVWFLARGPNLTAMRHRGLRVTGARGDFAPIQVNATDQPADIGPVSVALLTVKLWDIEEALKTIGPMIAPGTVVITLQNGVDAPLQVADAIGASRVAAGACFVNCGIQRPGWIVQRSETQKIVAGMFGGTSSAVLEHFAAACAASKIDFELTHTPLDVLWEKFIQLVPISAMTALRRTSLGAVRDDPESWNLFLQIFDEAVQAGRAADARIPPEVVTRRLEYIKNLPHEATSSMATDLMQGKRLELPWLSGRIAELGRRHGIPTPANDHVFGALGPFAMGRNSEHG